MYNYRTGELQNYTFYSNPEYDKVCEEQQRTADENARKELLYKMQDIIHEDRASIILYYENQTFGTRADAVSYTHLDVYKRQAAFTPRRLVTEVR